MTPLEETQHLYQTRTKNVIGLCTDSIEGTMVGVRNADNGAGEKGPSQDLTVYPLAGLGATWKCQIRSCLN